MTELEKKQKAIIDHYGVEKQLDMLVEECAELIQAIQKNKRYKDIPGDGKALEDVIEEIADVKNIITQLEINDEYLAKNVDIITDYKVHRELSRILDDLKATGQEDYADEIREKYWLENKYKDEKRLEMTQWGLDSINK